MKQAMLKGGQGANIQNINQKILAALEIPLPTKTLQEKFSKVVRVYRDSRLRVDCSFTDAENLFAAISHRAFSFELYGEVMIKEIQINPPVATYLNSKRINDLRRINYMLGANGKA